MKPSIIDNHIKRYLDSLIKPEIELFDANFLKLKEFSEIKNVDNYKKILKYVHILLDNSLFKNEEDFRELHLHFQIDLDDLENTIAQYLVFYYNSKLRITDSSKEINQEFSAYKQSLENHIKLPIHLNGTENNRRIKELRNLRKLLRIKNDDCNSILNYVRFREKVLFNTSTSIIDLLDFSTFSNLSTKISAFNARIKDFYSHPFYHIYINDKYNNLQDLDNGNQVFVDNLKHLILFENSNRVKYLDFSNSSLKRFLDDDYNLKSYLNISFDVEKKQNSLSFLESKLFNFQHKYNIDKSISYILTNEEINYLLEGDSNKSNKVKLKTYGSFNIDFYDSFFTLCRIYGLDEFRSIKFHNILNSIVNSEGKEYIVGKLFSLDSELISDETKEILFNELDIDEILELKDALNRFLNYSVECYNDLNISSYENIVIENVLYKDEEFVKKLNLKSETNLISNFQLSKDFKNLSGHYYTFCYRHRGNKNFIFYPNTIENFANLDLKIEFISNNVINENLIKELSYKYEKDKFKILHHELRNKLFDFSFLKRDIEKNKPVQSLILTVDKENIYSNYNTTERFLITYKNKNSTINKQLSRPKTDYLIYQYNSNNHISFDVISLEDFYEDNNEIAQFDFLDKILEEIDIFSLLNNETNDNEYLKSLALEHGFEDINAMYLWKYLLKNKVDKYSPNVVLKQLRDKLKSNIVSDNHFNTKWLDVNSDMISPRSKKVFRELCKFLNLPTEYYLIVLRHKISQVGNSREKNKFLEELAIELIKLKCFDDNVNSELAYNQLIELNIESIKEKFDFESLGVSEDLASTFLKLIVSEIKKELELKEFVKIETRSN